MPSRLVFSGKSTRVQVFVPLVYLAPFNKGQPIIFIYIELVACLYELGSCTNPLFQLNNKLNRRILYYLLEGYFLL